ELSVRAGAFGAVTAHLVEGQFGIATPMPLALFWTAAALATLPPWSRLRDPPAAPSRPPWWRAALVATALVAVTVSWLETRWLLASMAYARGVRAGMAGRTTQEAYLDFERSRTLMPWLPMAAEGAAFSALRLAGAEPEGSPRLTLLRSADAGLARLREGPAPT